MRNDKAVQAAVLNILYRELARKVRTAAARPSSSHPRATPCTAPWVGEKKPQVTCTRPLALFSQVHLKAEVDRSLSDYHLMLSVVLADGIIHPAEKVRGLSDLFFLSKLDICFRVVR
jgi:hypothetical protein